MINLTVAGSTPTRHCNKMPPALNQIQVDEELLICHLSSNSRCISLQEKTNAFNIDHAVEKRREGEKKNWSDESIENESSPIDFSPLLHVVRSCVDDKLIESK